MKHIVTKQVADEAGITEPQAEKAVDALIGYFKTRLPVETNNEIQGLITGEDEMH
jgi:nucleoid DNA-binding protein